MPSPVVRALRTGNPARAALLVLCLLLTWGAVPVLPDLAPPIGQAAGAEIQEAPTRCEAIGNNWTNCDDASSPDDVYAYANGTAGGNPITFIDVTEQSAAGTSLTVTVPNHQDGDTLIVVLVHSDDAPAVTITPAGGWNLVRDKTNLGQPAFSPPVLYIYERQASSEPASYDWSWDLTGGLLGVMLSYRGTDGASPIGQNATNAQAGTGSDAVAPSVTTLTDNELALWIGWSDDNDGNDPSATLSRGTARAREMTGAGGNGAFVGVGDENIPSPGATGTATWTLQAPEERSGATITLLPAPAVGASANDTAWFDFGLGLDPQDIVNRVEVGVEWWRMDALPILNVTVSWNGGSTWAPNQMATNKSVDDNTVEFLNFTAATVWNLTKLNDANLRVRVATNYSGARLDFLTVRVNYNLPAVDLTLVPSPLTADPGDVLTLNATIENLGPGTAHNFILEASVDVNASYRGSSPGGNYSAGTRMVQWRVSLLSPGERDSVGWTVRVMPGTPDGAFVNTSFRVTYENVTGSPLPPLVASAQTRVQVPVFDPVLHLDRSEAERGDVVLAILYYNNTGSGRALGAWANWTLTDHFELVDILPAQTFSASPLGFDIIFADLVPGPHSLVARLRVVRGLENGLAMELRVAWSATDGNGNALADATRLGAVTLLAPALTLTLGSSGTSVQVGSEFSLDAAVLNVGLAGGEGWLNLTLPPGVLFISSDGPLEVTATPGLVSWRIVSLNPGAQVQVEIRLRAEQGPSLESFVLSVDFTDGKGSVPVTEFSNEVFVRLLGTTSLPLPWWLFLLPLFIPVAFFAFYLNRRLRHPELRIEEVFVIHRKGILVAHQSRTLTPDRDRDILAAMFKAVQGFVQDAFSADAEGTMRGLRFENFNILIEQGTNHYVAVVYQGQESRVLERRVAELSQRIESEFGALLASWVGDMNEIRGIRRLLPVIWGESAAFGVGGGPEPVLPATPAMSSGPPKVVYESLPGKLAWWLPLPYRGARRLLRATSTLFRDLVQARRGVLIRLRYKARMAFGRLRDFVRRNER